MKFTLPHTIESGLGETMVFKEIIKDPDSEKVIIEGRCKPTAGPAMHVHLKQDEALTVVKGKWVARFRGRNLFIIRSGRQPLFSEMFRIASGMQAMTNL